MPQSIDYTIEDIIELILPGSSTPHKPFPFTASTGHVSHINVCVRT